MDELDDLRRSGYGQYCPISRALDLLGERWTLMIVRDMITGTTRFNDLARGLPGLSRSLLSKRLRQLEAAGLIERVGSQYLLTPAGEQLEPVVFGLGTWGARWAFGDPHPEELDAEVLIWWMHTRLDMSEFPGRRQVLHVRFTDDRRQYWIVVEAGTPSVCNADPGFAVDVTISADVGSLYQLWLGRLPLHEALRSRRVVLDGSPALVRRMPRAMLLSPIAPTVAAVS